eukprot:TRINITY_DN7758_c0_g1_i2.p1 TRINITY_DN7758_c0_g1~~TRINITY_DN7758_c0_g1_i2.p1  ORF type:complete len:288 (-),score=47.04 TRINITY_DN7758_c0_g1_i2:172-1035(-)
MCIRDSSRDEGVRMSQFENRLKIQLEVRERKSASKHMRTLSLLTDGVVCHNGHKFKWYRPLGLFGAMKVSSTDRTLLVLEWRAGTDMGFTLDRPDTIRMYTEGRDELIAEIRSRLTFLHEHTQLFSEASVEVVTSLSPPISPTSPLNRRTHTGTGTRRSRRQVATTHSRSRSLEGTGFGLLGCGPGSEAPVGVVVPTPPAYHHGPVGKFVPPPSYEAAKDGCDAVGSLGQDDEVVQELISRAIGIGYEEDKVRLAMQELQLFGLPLSIVELLDRLNDDEAPKLDQWL